MGVCGSWSSGLEATLTGTWRGIRQLPGGGRELGHSPLESLRVFPTAMPIPPSFLITIPSLEGGCLTCAI